MLWCLERPTEASGKKNHENNALSFSTYTSQAQAPPKRNSKNLLYISYISYSPLLCPQNCPIIINLEHVHKMQVAFFMCLGCLLSFWEKNRNAKDLRILTRTIVRHHMLHTFQQLPFPGVIQLVIESVRSGAMHSILQPWNHTRASSTLPYVPASLIN